MRRKAPISRKAFPFTNAIKKLVIRYSNFRGTLGKRLSLDLESGQFKRDNLAITHAEAWADLSRITHELFTKDTNKSRFQFAHIGRLFEDMGDARIADVAQSPASAERDQLLHDLRVNQHEFVIARDNFWRDPQNLAARNEFLHRAQNFHGNLSIGVHYGFNANVKEKVHLGVRKRPPPLDIGLAQASNSPAPVALTPASHLIAAAGPLPGQVLPVTPRGTRLHMRPAHLVPFTDFSPRTQRNFAQWPTAPISFGAIPTFIHQFPSAPSNSSSSSSSSSSSKPWSL
jgi:hypothetical protein